MLKSSWANIIAAIVGAVATWILNKINENSIRYVKDFIITFSPVFVGLIVYFIYWIVRTLLTVKKLTEDNVAEIKKSINEINRHDSEHRMGIFFSQAKNPDKL